MGNIFGYIRVSSRDQNEDRQLIALKELAIPEKNIFIDKQSGKDFKRPQYRKMIRRVRKDDLLYIKSIDRLGRNYVTMRKYWNSGEFSQKIKELILWFLICLYLTLAGEKI